MTNFVGLKQGSDLTDVLKLFPRNSEMLIRLLDGIMCSEGELSRGEREAIAAFISTHNTTPYCTFYHSLFAEVFAGPIEEINERIEPLLTYALSLRARNSDEIARTSKAAMDAGWSEGAVYEVVEVCGIFDFINTIVLAAGLEVPDGPMDSGLTLEGLERFYSDTADVLAT
ncbi:MAG: hypothetical protein AB3N07_10655 [Ruegeria sp.]|uniref:hypothetical protein n=1 Tax=Ruegeria sp. ANG-S4 TaxID=1577904 RepID=UPI00057ED574|nr:hypothetical protein [Ruegeria sp. ANG-S4]KIC41806.1 hypothetical protein RA28_20735 [Ruegeria sp. ANG-S4]